MIATIAVATMKDNYDVPLHEIGVVEKKAA